MFLVAPPTITTTSIYYYYYFFFLVGRVCGAARFLRSSEKKIIIQQERGTRGRFGHVTQGYAPGAMPWAIRFGIFANLFTLSVLSEMFVCMLFACVCIACLFPRWIPDAYRTLSVYVFDALERKKAFRDIAGFCCWSCDVTCR